MKNKILVAGLLVSVIGIGCVFAIDKFKYINLPEDAVRVDFVNESGQTIKEINIGTTKIRDIVPGEKENFVFYPVEHKGSYHFDLEFESGKRMSGTRYVERGYYLTEIIKPDSVITKY